MFDMSSWSRSRASGFCFRWFRSSVDDVAEGLLEVEAFARARRDLLAAGGEVLFERLGVARELRAELVDLAAQIARLLIFDRRPSAHARRGASRRASRSAAAAPGALVDRAERERRCLPCCAA